MTKFDKNMTNGQIESLKRDFAQTFEGVESSEIDAEAIYDWAVNTRAVYEWFYTRFESMCRKRLAHGSLGSIERSYKPAFLEWATYQTIPCKYADFLNSLSAKVCYSDCNKAGNMLYDYYLTQFKESSQAPT